MASEGNMRIEALEHQLMRAWLEGDRKLMKKLPQAYRMRYIRRFGSVRASGRQESLFVWML